MATGIVLTMLDHPDTNIVQYESWMFVFKYLSDYISEVRGIVSCDLWCCLDSIPFLYKQSLGQDRLGGAWPDSPVLTSQSTTARRTVSVGSEFRLS